MKITLSKFESLNCIQESQSWKKFPQGRPEQKNKCFFFPFIPLTSEKHPGPQNPKQERS
jgi:hypothetical protein